MTTSQTSKREYLYKIINEYSTNPYCLELLQFLGWHPNTRFSGPAILHALSINSERRYIEIALKHLIDKGVVKTYSENNTSFYFLTDNEILRQEALDIAGLDWSEWKDVMQQSYTHLWSYLTPRKMLLASAIK